MNMLEPAGRCERAVTALFAVSLLVSCAGIGAVGVPDETRAQEPPTANRASEGCEAAATQLELSFCRARLARDAEIVEDGLYAQAAKRLRDRNRAHEIKLLEESEQKWRDYRDAHCRAAAEVFAGGSVAGVIESDCRARLARNRVAELKAVYLDLAGL